MVLGPVVGLLLDVAVEARFEADANTREEEIALINDALHTLEAQLAKDLASQLSELNQIRSKDQAVQSALEEEAMEEAKARAMEANRAEMERRELSNEVVQWRATAHCQHIRMLHARKRV